MKSKKLIQFTEQFNNITLLKMFEEKVIKKETNEEDYIIFDIEVRGSFLVADHVALTKKEEKSKFIATKRVKIDTDFSMDENLNELYSECIQGIIDSDFYTLAE